MLNIIINYYEKDNLNDVAIQVATSNWSRKRQVLDINK